MKIIASNYFLKFKKKSSKKLQLELDNQINAIVDDPGKGELKKGDLKGIRVQKFTYKNQLYLLSYELIDDQLCLYTIGSHENFYKKLKGYRK